VNLFSGAPDLQKVLEGGEFKRGSMSDGKEVYQIFTYGRIISYTRQAMINDDLSALDRTPRALAGAGRRLENRTVYGILTTNGALQDTGNSVQRHGCQHRRRPREPRHGHGFRARHGLAHHARAAMRVQKGKQAEELNVAPSGT
jgi:hypothetical protein